MKPFLHVSPVFSCVVLSCLSLLALGSLPSRAAEASTGSPGDRRLADYFKAETEALSSRCLADVRTLADWESTRAARRSELFEMLSLSPLPARSDLKPVVTGKIEHDGFTVEKLHFQSMPGLYVTANLYVPKKLVKPAPAVLYLCGHALVKTNGVSYGNKTAYQHHGIWFARNGYVCLMIDTIQLGEIEGVHHGTYREGMWWWNSRGYSPAGVEAWNAIRSLDYLQSRPEVDGEKLGVTGRSGGGAYSWFAAALDERVKVAAPVAGITDLENHVVDGTVEGHCDCMFFVNTYRWDYPMMAALVAPRPLLICNSDKDSIFPLNGVVRLHSKVKRIYELYGATNHLGLLITEGPHKDTQDLQVPVFRWFNRHLKGEDLLVEKTGIKLFTPEQLKVFAETPADECVRRIHETFVPRAPLPALPEDAQTWSRQCDEWKRELAAKVFGGWPSIRGIPAARLIQSIESGGVALRVVEFDSQPHVPLRLYLLQSTRVAKPERILLDVRDAAGWGNWMAIVPEEFSTAFGGSPIPRNAGEEQPKVEFANWVRQLETERLVTAIFAPRGIGPDAWSAKSPDQAQIRRRFMLLGQTLDAMQVWDIGAAVRTIHSFDLMAKVPLTLKAEGVMAVNAIYAALFERSVSRVDLLNPPTSHREGAEYLNIQRILDVPQAAAMVAENASITLRTRHSAEWHFPEVLKQRIGWSDGRFVIKEN
jgi:dienelactone hydrolase